MKKYLCLLCVVFFSSCTEYMTIVTNVHEKDANLILVLLESKGISAKKDEVVVTGAGTGGPPNFNILVNTDNRIEAMAILNQNGLPRRYGQNLLGLFTGGGLIANAKTDSIRYEQGLSSQIANTLLMIDGILDISVQISSSSPDQKGQSKAAVYVKHQGVLDDPNSHLESKIKRLVAASAQNLPIENVTIISDRARISDIDPQTLLGKFPAEVGKEYVKVWSMVMSSDSVGTFRTVFFFLLCLAILFSLLLFWMVWKIYPIIKGKGGLKELFTLAPYQMPKQPGEEE